jgi:hypothetical protein
VSWVSPPERAALERALAGRGLDLRLEGSRATLFFPDGGGLEGLRVLLAMRALPEVRSIVYGELSLTELYRELYGVEGV